MQQLLRNIKTTETPAPIMKKQRKADEMIKHV